MNIDNINQLISLIENEATGTPQELAEKFKVSKRMIHMYIDLLKQEFKAPIEYNKKKQSYSFSEKGTLNLKWIPGQKK